MVERRLAVKVERLLLAKSRSLLMPCSLKAWRPELRVLAPVAS